MNKIIFTLAISTILFSCNEEKKQAKISPELIENKTVDSVETTTDIINLKELSSVEMSSYIADKKNDTIYITNFFATWCGPCMQEIPHFIAKKEELKDQPVKFNFVSIDEKDDWDTKVKDFAIENNLEKNIILLDGEKLDEAFFKNNFTTWDGSGIPFTIIKKGNKSEEILGFTSEETLSEKINFLK